MIKVLLVDDHQMFLDGVQSFLEKEENIVVTGKVLNGKECLDFLDKSPVDVVLMDIEMPQLNGIETTMRINQKYPKTKVLILSMYKKKSFVIKLLEAGASGFVLKNKSKEELLFAIYNVYQDRPHFGLEILRTASSKQVTPSSQVKLTDREIEILKLVAEGYTTKEISSKLSISSLTVNTHRRNLLNKLELRNVQGLVHYAIKEGIIKIE